MEMDTFTRWMLFLLASFVVFGTLLIIGLLYDMIYIKPIADLSANNYCKSQGFDQYKAFSRVGIFSKVPIGIKCEYAERYTNLGIKTNPA